MLVSQGAAESPLVGIPPLVPPDCHSDVPLPVVHNLLTLLHLPFPLLLGVCGNDTEHQ